MRPFARSRPAFLEAFTFKATPSAKPIIDALDVLKALYRTGQRSLPAKPPIRFIRRVWRPLVIQGGEIDRKAYELCAFFELRDRLRAGDIWVEGSRQYQDFESYLIPEPTFALLKAEGPLPVAIDTDVESYLAGRRALSSFGTPLWRGPAIVHRPGRHRYRQDRCDLQGWRIDREPAEDGGSPKEREADHHQEGLSLVFAPPEMTVKPG
jgi:hypothetical protein